MNIEPDLIIVGQATIDDIYREADNISYLATPGGDAIYATIGASVWPINIGVVTIVGKDYPYKKLKMATCSKNKTDWSGVKIYQGPSIHDKAIYHADGSREYEFYDPVLIFGLSPASKDIPLHMQNVKYVHIAPAKTEQQLDVLHFYKSRHAVVSLDVETHFIKEDIISLNNSLELDPIFIPSLEHVQILSDINSKYIDDHWEWISRSGVSNMIIKCGSQGAFIIDTKKKKYAQMGIVQNLNIVDTTGAGDAFCGGFMAGFMKTKDYFRASAFGAVSSSFIVESIGAIKPDTYSSKRAEKRLMDLLEKNPVEFRDIER